MTMKKISLVFRGKFNICSMSVMVRLWNTTVCISDESCSLRCKPLNILCHVRDRCIKAPISACDKCRSHYLRTIYNDSAHMTNDALFQFLCANREKRETFESLKDDMFFRDYEDELVRSRPIWHKVWLWMKSLSAYGIVGVGWHFISPQPCLILSRIHEDGFVLEIERRHYDKNKNIVGDKIDFQKNFLGLPEDFTVQVVFANVDLTYSNKISGLQDEFRSFFESFTKEEVSCLYDIDLGKLYQTAKKVCNPLSFSSLLKQD